MSVPVVPAVLEAPTTAAPLMTLRRYMTLVGWGLLVTTLGQTQSIGILPLRFLLKRHLHTSPTAMAAFLSVILLPWTFKPIAGLLSDGVPLFGSRRRTYLLLSCVVGGLCWLAMGAMPRSYLPLLWAGVALNVSMVFASTVTGGVLVEGAQAHGATGRLSSLRLVVINIAYIVSGPAGGFLAAHWFGWTALTGALLLFSMVPMTWFLLREPALPRGTGQTGDALRGIWHQIKTVFPAKTLWMAGGLLFLIQVAPGLYTPLFYHQTNNLKFSEQFIGNLQVLYGGMGLLGSFVYPLFCRRVRLRWLLVFAVACTAMSNLAYLGYVSRNTAMVIEGAAGLGITLAQLPLFDLAARATPKGSEALAYSLIIAIWNVGLSLSDLIGSYLFDEFKLTFQNLVWVNAGTTILVIFAVPFLPSRLIDRKEGESV